MNNLIKKILVEWSFRLDDGMINLNNPKHISILREVLQDMKLSTKVVMEVIENITTKKSNKKTIVEVKGSDKDLPLLRNLGAQESISDEDLQNIIDDKVNLSGVSCGRGTGNTAFEDNNYDKQLLTKILSDGNKFVLTYSGNEKKLRTEYNVRICKWNNAKKKDDVNYKRIALMFQMCKKFGSKIEVKKRVAAGIGFEDMQISELKAYFTELSEKPIPLFVDGKDMGVDVNSASTVKGVPKADFTLDKDGTPVFWVSYKHGEYYKSEHEVNAKVPFQQYGSMSSFFDKSFEQKVGVKGLEAVSTGFLKKVVKNLKESYKGVTAIKVDGKDVELTMGKKKTTIKDKHTIFSAKTTFYEQNIWKTHKKIDLYIMPPKGGYYRGFEDDPAYADIAGATIYGTEFKKGNTKFSKENVNILLQAKEKLRLSPMLNAEGELKGVNLNTSTAGHITFNPNVPENNPKIAQYLPVFLVRHTKANVTGFKDGSKTNLIAGGRYLIMPRGNATGKEI
jgi:hypothetical protein